MATTIGDINIRLGINASGVTSGINAARGSLNSLSGIFRALETPVERFNRQMDMINKALARGRMTAEKHAQAMKLIEAEFVTATAQGKEFNTMLREQEASQARMQRWARMNDRRGGMMSAAAIAVPEVSAPIALARLGGPALAAGAVAIGVQQTLSAFSQQEQSLASLEVLYGSATKAAEDYASIRQLAAQSNLSTTDLLSASKTLVGFGMETNKLLPVLRQLSDISMGNSEKFASLALAFAQVQAAGRLTGQELLQMVNAGFNPLRVISEQTGKGMAELRVEMERGAISVAMVEQAFLAATEAGGRYEGMTERMANTVSGKWGQMTDAVQRLGAGLGTWVAGPAKITMDALGGISNGAASAIESFNHLMYLLSNQYQNDFDANMQAINEAAKKQLSGENDRKMLEEAEARKKIQAQEQDAMRVASEKNAAALRKMQDKNVEEFNKNQSDKFEAVTRKIQQANTRIRGSGEDIEGLRERLQNVRQSILEEGNRNIYSRSQESYQLMTGQMQSKQKDEAAKIAKQLEVAEAQQAELVKIRQELVDKQGTIILVGK